MSLFIRPFSLVIQPGGKINFGSVVFTCDKIILNNSAEGNSYNVGDANFNFNNSTDPSFAFGPTFGNTVTDNDLVDAL